MTIYTWKEVDFDKIAPGDLIGEEYVVSIRDIGITKKERTISQERHIVLKTYRREFTSLNTEGAGWSFPVDTNGNPLEDRFIDRIKELVADPNERDEGIVSWSRTLKIAAVIECVCGGQVSLEMVMTNTCSKCHRDYNSSGQLLAPRNQWGWDTGESLDDILSADWNINDPTPGREEYDY